MKTKEVRGITIISLVVTIVVLLILAGVSVSLVIGNNNLFDKAKSTQKIQTIAGIKEALELEKADIQVESKTVNLENYLEQISTGKKNYDLSSTEKIDNKNAYIIINDQYKFLLKDKGNGDVEIIYEGVAVLGDLTLSSYEETYTYPNSGTFTVTNNASGGELTVSSDAPNIATASIEENIITVVPGTTAGKANIIVKSAANGEYIGSKIVHTATIENGTIKLSATPYTGIYDGQEHDALSDISVKPRDVQLEYSINGGQYSEKMPKIKDTSEFTVTVKASKEGYKTISITETVKVNKAEGSLTLSSTSGVLMYPNATTFTASENTGTLSVVSSNTNVATVSVSGNTVTVKSGSTAGTAIITVTSAANTNHKAKSATYNITVDNINSLKIGDYVNYKYDTAGKYTLGSKYSGDSREQSISQTTDMKWRILNIDKTTETIDLISEKITNEEVYFNGILGYNNGPYFMNEICKAQYSNKSLGAYARSINLLDMEKHLTTKGIVARSAWSNAVQYGKTKRYTSSSYRYYPSLYINQKGAGVNTTSVTQPDITKGNDPYEESKAIATTEPTTDSSYGKASSTGLTLTQTYYDIDFNSENYGDAASVLPAQPGYWVAARYVLADTKNASWGLRLGTDDSMYGLFLFSSDIGTSSVGIALRPVVSISSRALAGIKDSSGAWNLK